MALTLVIISALALGGIDQIIKYFVFENLTRSGAVDVIPYLLSLLYVENRGVAFGMFQNMQWLFAIFTVIIIAGMIFLIVKKYFSGKLFYIGSALIIGGGIGNLIDRVFRGFVIDYLQLSFFPPVCNFADYCVTIGAVLFVISIFISDNKVKQDE